MIDVKSSSTPASPRRPRRPPPNYSSRSMQLRLLVLVFLVMTVLVLMKEARNPENWHFFQRLEDAALQMDRAAEQGPIDTRPAPQPTPTDGSAEPTVRGPRGHVALEHLLDSSFDRSLATAQLNSWSTVCDSLAQSQRELLRQGLWQHRHGRALEVDQQRPWLDLLAHLTRQWSEYEARARQLVAENHPELAPARQQLCRDVLAALHQRWQQQLSALTALTGEAAVTDEQQRALAELQQVLDRRAWQAVQDNTVLRSHDHDAWLRSWELVESATSADPAAADAGTPVSFVQLFSQPESYRGRLVRVRGTARLGYHVASREQHVGIHGYDVVWLRPDDGSNSPIAVYLQSLPPGFPPLPEQTADNPGRALQEEVTVTGIFFKRWLYGSRGGLNLTPLVLGTITHWTPQSPAEVDAGLRGLTPRTLAACVGAAALVSLVLAVWVYRTNRWSGRHAMPSAAPPSVLPQFDEQSVRHGEWGMGNDE